MSIWTEKGNGEICETVGGIGGEGGDNWGGEE